MAENRQLALLENGPCLQNCACRSELFHAAASVLQLQAPGHSERLLGRTQKLLLVLQFEHQRQQLVQAG